MLSGLRRLFGRKSKPTEDDVMRAIDGFANVISDMLTLQLPWGGLDFKATNWGAHRPVVISYILGASAGAQELGALGDETRMALYMNVALPRLAKSREDSEIEAVHNEIYYLTAGPNVPAAIAAAFEAGQMDFAEVTQGKSPRRLVEIIGFKVTE